MFERFTQGARRAVVLAQEEARQQGSPTIGVQHLLVGVLSDTTAAPAVVLARWSVDARTVAELADIDDRRDHEALSVLGIDLDEVRRRAEEQFGAGALDERPRTRWGRRIAAGHIPFTPGAKAALKQAVSAAVLHQDREIGSAQLFLGLLADESVQRALSQLGVTAKTEDLSLLIRERLQQAA